MVILVSILQYPHAYFSIAMLFVMCVYWNVLSSVSILQCPVPLSITTFSHLFLLQCYFFNAMMVFNFLCYKGVSPVLELQVYQSSLCSTVEKRYFLSRSRSNGCF